MCNVRICVVAGVVPGRRDGASPVNAHPLYYYVVVHGAFDERQAAHGAQPADARTQVGDHRVPTVQPAIVVWLRRATGATSRRVRRAAGTPVHGQRRQRQQHRVQRGHVHGTGSAGHSRSTTAQQTGRAKEVSFPAEFWNFLIFYLRFYCHGQCRVFNKHIFRHVLLADPWIKGDLNPGHPSKFFFLFFTSQLILVFKLTIFGTAFVIL